MKLRVVWITVAITLVLLVTGLVAGSQWFQSYLRGREFLALISGLTGSAFDAKANIDPLQWTGPSAYSERITLEGTPSSPVITLEARQIRAEMNWRAFFDGAWRIEEINIARLNGKFTVPVSPADSPPASAQQAPPARSWLPKRFELGQANVADAAISFGDFTASHLALVVRPDGNGWLISGSGGTLQAPRLPELKILQARARAQGGDFFLSAAELQLGESGKISASGSSTGGGSLLVNWDGVNVADVLDPGWKKRLAGVLSGTATWKAANQTGGEFALRDGRIENIPMLGLIGDFTGNPSFRRMPIQEMAGNFTYEKGVLEVTGFFAESKGLFRIEGSSRIGPGNALEGQFEVGVTPQTLQWLPGSRERVFRNAKNGYLWTNVAVGGTIQSPTEDLSARLAAAMGGELIEKGAGVLQNAPGNAVEGVKSVLDILRPLVP
jgi:hypothetical protein